MKKFIYKTLLLLSPFILFWVGTELLYRLVPNNYSKKHELISQSFNDTQILIFGSSHTFYGLNPAWFNTKAFNMANVSQTLYFDQLLFEKYLYNYKDLKYIVLNVEYFTLSQDDNMPELQWRKYFYESQMDLNTSMVSNYDIKKYSLALAPRFTVTQYSIEQFVENKTLAECDNTGWAGKTGINAEYNNPIMGEAIANKHEDNSIDFTKNLNRLKSIIDACKLRGIKVLLVTMPVTSHYADNVNKEKLKLIVKECKVQDSLYDNVSYINLFQDKRFDNNDFYDTDHLNSEGAKKCSLIINDFIN